MVSLICETIKRDYQKKDDFLKLIFRFKASKNLTLKFEKIVPVIMKNTRGSTERILFGEKYAQLVEIIKSAIRG